MSNRDLKFRVWDGDKKKYEYFELRNMTVPDRLLCHHKYSVQQFTGFKDSEDNEIYEGDTIEFETDNKNYKGLVVWTHGAYSVLAKTLDEEKFTTRIWFKDLYEDIFDYKVKVIGNIFELPCKPDHNGECLFCDEPLDGCLFNKNKDDKVIEIMGMKLNQHWAEQLLDVCKTTSVISEEQISLDLPEKYKPEFEEFMRGKTCPILDNGQKGVYSWDFEQYLKTVLRNF